MKRHLPRDPSELEAIWHKAQRLSSLHPGIWAEGRAAAMKGQSVYTNPYVAQNGQKCWLWRTAFYWYIDLEG